MPILFVSLPKVPRFFMVIAFRNWFDCLRIVGIFFRCFSSHVPLHSLVLGIFARFSRSTWHFFDPLFSCTNFLGNSFTCLQCVRSVQKFNHDFITAFSQLTPDQSALQTRRTCVCHIECLIQRPFHYNHLSCTFGSTLIDYSLWRIRPSLRIPASAHSYTSFVHSFSAVQSTKEKSKNTDQRLPKSTFCGVRSF
jgi:hypothetical protein